MQIIGETYDVKLLISEHFDSIINKIDLKAENKLLNYLNDVDTTRIINEERNELIERVEEIKQINLDANQNTQKNFEEKWNPLINNENIPYENKLDVFKRDLIKKNVVLARDSDFLIELSIWVTRGFIPEKKYI